MAISIAQLFFFITLSVGFFFFSSFRKVSFISCFFPCSVILCYSLQVFIFQLATLKVYLSVYWAHILAIPVIESEDTKSTYPKEIIKFWELVYRGGVKKCQNMTFKVNFLCQKSSESFWFFFHWRIWIKEHICCYWHFLIKSIFKAVYY